MKINKITLIVSVLILAITTQQAHGMQQLQALKKNPYVTYGAVALTSFTLGAGLMHYWMKPKVTPEPTQELMSVQLRFKTTEQLELEAFCSQEDLQIISSAGTCCFESINEQELRVHCSRSIQSITFYSNKTINNPNQSSSNKFDMELYDFEWKHLVGKSFKIDGLKVEWPLEKTYFTFIE